MAGILDIMEIVPTGEERTLIASSSDVRTSYISITNKSGSTASVNIYKEFNGLKLNRYMEDLQLYDKASFLEDKPVVMKANTLFKVSSDQDVEEIIEGEYL